MAVLVKTLGSLQVGLSPPFTLPGPGLWGGARCCPQPPRAAPVTPHSLFCAHRGAGPTGAAPRFLREPCAELLCRPCVDCHAFEFMQRALQDLKKTAYSLDSRTETLLFKVEKRTLCDCLTANTLN
uniref:NELL2-interacting cell ontogeny regulator 1 n=1 Tax=Varanus komodoensis TaxID=61221 RepID=A0A8D2IVZ6_VARKO